MAGQDTSTAFWVQAPGRGELREAPLPEPVEGEVRVRALFSGISRGTESLVFRGGVPASQYEAMRCPFQEGDFPGPVKYGYMSVGVVEDGRGARSEALAGRLVFCLHPHQDRYVVPVEAVTPLPDDLPAERAVLAANMETAVNGVWDAAPGVGDRIVVVGAGVVGLLAGWLCRGIPGTEVTMVDPQPARIPVAEALGLTIRPTPPAGSDADVVLHASGHPDGLADALTTAGPEATIVELSWFGDRPVSLPLGESFHARRLTIRSSQVGTIPPTRAPRWTPARRLSLALDLLRDPVLDALVSDESAFHMLPSVMADLASGRSEPTLCHRIAYGDPAAGSEPGS
jgi:threonine dehydrogenase-like Zn-dependent dehydrogenase